MTDDKLYRLPRYYSSGTPDDIAERVYKKSKELGIRQRQQRDIVEVIRAREILAIECGKEFNFEEELERLREQAKTAYFGEY